MSEKHTFAEISSVLEVKDGLLVWRIATGNTKVGKVAGSRCWQGYVQIGYQGKRLLAHRVVWLLVHGRWPRGMLDHINGIRNDNRPENLRESDPIGNSANRKPSGAVKFNGVVLHKQTGKFQVTCGRKYVGLFRTAEEAAKAYDKAALAKYGEFARLNFGDAA